MTSRRHFLESGAALAAALASAATATATVRMAATPASRRARRHAWQGGASPWPLCLDTATIRPADLETKVRVAAAAGFDAIEPWDGELRDYERSGGDLVDLGERIRDAGLFVPSVIGLWDAIPPTPEAWERQLPATRERMRMISAIGSRHVQVVPGPPREGFALEWLAARYRDLLELGVEYDLSPALVFVNFLPHCRKIGQATAVAVESGHPGARIIPDVFHMYLAGSPFSSLDRLRGDLIAIFQLNDAPAAPERSTLKDEHRVYPGDGVLPLGDCLRSLVSIGYQGPLSLELYNPSYWEQDPERVAKTGREKTLAVIAEALAD